MVENLNANWNFKVLSKSPYVTEMVKNFQGKQDLTTLSINLIFL